MRTDSDDYTTDEGKRKADDIDNLFKRSKKTPRTPRKEMVINQDMMVTMMDLLSNLSVDIKKIKAQQHNCGNDMKILKEEIKQLREEQKEYKSKIKILREIDGQAMREIDQLKKEVSHTSHRLEKLEGEKRRKNIVVQGLSMETNMPDKLRIEMENFIKSEIGIELKANSARKIGAKSYLVELNNDEDKIKVMQNKSKLKELQQKIYINDDLTQKKRSIQAKIRTRAKEEKIKGRNVKIGCQKLIVDNEVWKWSKNEEILKKMERYKQKKTNRESEKRGGSGNDKAGKMETRKTQQSQKCR